MSLPEILKEALEKIHYMAKTETVFGDPIVAGNVTLIPVSKVSIGFAAGGAEGSTKNSGSGTGGGVQITPVAFISVHDGKVSMHLIEKQDPYFTQLLALAPELLKKVSSFLDKKKKDKENE